MHVPSPLLGQAVGDALGMPFETYPPDHPSLREWDGYGFHKSQYHNLAEGMWTDDTMMATLLAESLIENGTYDPHDVSKRYVRWLESGDHRGMGKTTKIALQNLQSKIPWGKSGVQGAEGNGSAMRVIPLGVAFAWDPSLLKVSVQIESEMTHSSKEAEVGALAVALAASYLYRGVPKKDLPRLLSENLEDSEVKRGISKVEFYRSAGGIGLAEVLSLLGTKAHVVQTVPSAIAALVLAGSHQEAVVSAIRAGGDTDTVAAIAGGLAGILYGKSGINQTHAVCVDDSLRLQRLDQQLVELSLTRKKMAETKT